MSGARFILHMRRLVLEWSLKDVSKRLKDAEKHHTGKPVAELDHGIESPGVQQDLKLIETLQKIKSFEILHFLRFDQDETAAIFKVKFKDPSVNVKDVLSDRMLRDFDGKLQLLENDEDGASIYFIKGRPPRPTPAMENKRISMYPLLPFSFRDGKVRVTLVGSDEQVKEVLDNMKNEGISCRVVSLMDAKFSPSSPISRLTEKQRDAITLAFSLGYFDTPRKISTEELATKLGLADSTFVVHLRRAERRLLANMLDAP